MSTDSAPPVPASASTEPVVGSVQYARLHMDAGTKAVVTQLVGEDFMAKFLASDRDKGGHNRADFNYKTSTLDRRFCFIFADMLIAAAPQAAQRTLSITSLVQPRLEVSETAAATAALIDKMCPYEAHAAKRLAEANKDENAEDDKTDSANKADKDDVDEANIELFLNHLWVAFLEAIRAVPYDNPLQYELLGFLRSLEEKSRGPVDAWGAERDLWADLPLYGAMTREFWIPTTVPIMSYGRCVRDNRSSEELENECEKPASYAPKWVNFATFKAREIVTGPSGSFGWMLYGIGDLAGNLETSPMKALRGPFGQIYEPGDAITSSKLLSFSSSVRVACHWILLVGRKIYRLAIRDIDDNLDEGRAFLYDELSQQMLRGNMGALYRESGGTKKSKFGPRWLFWQKRLETLGSDNEDDPNSGMRIGLDDDLRALARLTAQRMGEYKAAVDAEIAEKGWAQVKKENNEEEKGRYVAAESEAEESEAEESEAELSD